jgi:hypothetical protein
MSEIDTSRGPNFAPPEQIPTKVCPSCSVQTNTAGLYCPHCGSAFTRQPIERRRPSRRLLLGLLVLLLIIGGTAGAVKIRHDNGVKAAHAAALADQHRKDAIAKASADAKAAADTAERANRKEIVTEMEASILKDARSKATGASGVALDGPILRVLCTPLGGGSADDLTALTGTFECTAVNKDNADGSSEGYRFAATTNWNDGTYSWHLG